MAVAKSKLNSKLPKVADIRFCTSAGKNLCTSISTGENSKFSIAVNFKQPANRKSFTSYQIQYRYRNQYTDVASSNAYSVNWTAWSNWACMKTRAGSSKAKQGSTSNPDTWLCGNQGLTKTTYNQFWKWANAAIGGNYVARQYQFRVRVYNGNKKMHGAWVTSQAMTIKRLCEVRDETIHTAYGNAYLDFNLKWHTWIFLRMHSIKDSKNRELLKIKVEQGNGVDKTRLASSTPPLRNGYTPARNILEVGDLKRSLVPGEKLTVNIWAETENGARTYWTKNITVTKVDFEINKPRIGVSLNKNTQVLTIKAFKTDADDVIKSGDIRLKYTYLDKEYVINPYKNTKALNVKNTKDPIMTAVFPFAPLNTDLQVIVDLGNGVANKSFTMGKTRIDVGRAWYVNKANNPNRAAAIMVEQDGYPSFEIRSQAKVTVELPYGRNLPFAAYSPGKTTSIQITGTATETSLGIKKMQSRMAPRYWHDVRNDPGIYYLRGPNGEMYKSALEEVQMNRESKDYTHVTASFQEVS